MAKAERIGGADRARLRELAAGRYWSEEDGRAALAAFDASGLTRVALRRETGISPQRLKWRRRRLGEAPGPAGKIQFLPVGISTDVSVTDNAVMEGDSLGVQVFGEDGGDEAVDADAVEGMVVHEAAA